MDKNEFLDRIIDIVKIRFKLKEEPIYKTFSPNVQKINGKWIENDRAFLYSPPGWLKPDFNISKKNKIYTTGHHIGNSYHDYNSMESAVQNSSELLSKIEEKYNYKISKPWTLSSIIRFLIYITVLLLIFVYRKNIIKRLKL